MRRYDTLESDPQQVDFSAGVIGMISDAGGGLPARHGGRRIRHCKYADNAIFRPALAVGTRGGSRSISAVDLAQKPVSLAKYYDDGGNRLFVSRDASGTGSVVRYTEAGETVQTLPYTPSARRFVSDMANEMLVAAQQGGSEKPVFFHASNPANTWHSLVLPKPAAAPTFGADQAGGSLTAAVPYFWRVRWRYTNGSSLSSPVSASRTMTAPNLTARITIPLPASPRTDYVGWTLERTKANGGTATSPFYQVADGTAASYDDGANDADLWVRASEVLHGEPVHMDGIVFHKSRLFGWIGSDLYLSQAIGDEQGTGLANWQGDLVIRVRADDGDSIQCVLSAGDRLVILKRHSTHVLLGDDLDSFRLEEVSDGVGCTGPRAAASLNGVVYFYSGQAGLFRLTGRGVQPWGWPEVGHYLADADNGHAGDFLMTTEAADFIYFTYRPIGKEYVEDWLVYDLRFGNWTHYNGWRAADALFQRDRTDFQNAGLLFADPLGLAGAGPGFYAAWKESRVTNQARPYLQRVNGDGTVAFGTNGLGISALNNLSSQRLSPLLVTDGGTGVIAVWVEQSTGSPILRAQRYDRDGVAMWTVNGVEISTSIVDQDGNHNAVADGEGGVVVVWQDETSGVHTRAQRVTSAGAVQWGASGVQVSTLRTGAVLVKLNPRVVLAAEDSFIVFYEDGEGSTNYDIYAQRLDGAGARQWATAGVQVFGNTDPQRYSVACADGLGGAYVAWVGFERAADQASVYLHRIDEDGLAVAGWPALGAARVTVSDAADRDTDWPVEIVSDGANGCIVAWRETRAAVKGVYAQRYDAATAAALYLAGGQLVFFTYDYELTGFLRVARSSDGHTLIAVIADDTPVVQKMDLASGAAMWTTADYGGVAMGTKNLTTGIARSRLEMCADTVGGAVVVWCEDRGGAAGTDLYGNRISQAGSLQWASLGLLIANNLPNTSGNVDLGQQWATKLICDGAGAGSYRVWAGNSGFRDEVGYTGEGGTPIPWMIETPFVDGGRPGDLKDFGDLTAFIEEGVVDMTATLHFDTGPDVAVGLAASLEGYRYDDGDDVLEAAIGEAVYDAVAVFAAEGTGTAISGLPEGTIARRVAARFNANVTADFVFGGFVLKDRLLPEWRHS